MHFVNVMTLGPIALSALYLLIFLNHPTHPLDHVDSRAEPCLLHLCIPTSDIVPGPVSWMRCVPQKYTLKS